MDDKLTFLKLLLHARHCSEAPVLRPLDAKSRFAGKDPDTGKD